MVQFIAALVMGINAIRIGCDFPMWMQYSCCAYMLSFLVLFSDFYIKVWFIMKIILVSNNKKLGENFIFKGNCLNWVHCI